MALFRMALIRIALLRKLNFFYNREGGAAKWWDQTATPSGCYIPSEKVKLISELSCLSFNRTDLDVSGRSTGW
jgi:hypothetical protein